MPSTERPRPVDPRWPSAADWLATGPAFGVPLDVALLGVPTFATSISPSRAHQTPAAVRRMLGRLATWAPEHGVDLVTLGAADLGDVDDPDSDPDGGWRVGTRVAEAAAQARLVLVVGGDNSLTAPATVGALGSDLERGGLVTLDAHHDLREGRSNGSPVRHLLEAGLAPERVVQVGLADWANSRSYSDEAHARGLHAIRRGEVERRGIAACMADALALAGAAGGPVFVDLDLDVCDRSVAPGCPASLPGGLSARELLTAAHLAGRHHQVVAVDLTELDAAADPDGRTVRLAAMALLEAAAGLALREGPEVLT